MYKARVLTPSLPPTIDPVDVVKKQGHFLTIVNHWGGHSRVAIGSDNVRYCDTVGEAREFILGYLKNKLFEAQSAFESRQKQLSDFQESIK